MLITTIPFVSQSGGSGTGNTGMGYFGGGSGMSSSYLATIEGINFSSETMSIPTTSLVAGRYGLTGVNSTTKGYFGGGRLATYTTNEVDGIVFATETLANPSATIYARYYAGGINSSAKGYFGGGFTGTAYTNEIDGIDFSTEAYINPLAAISNMRWQPCGISSSTKGYFCGGGNAATPYQTKIDGFEFSTSTSTNPSATLTLGRSYTWSGGFNSTLAGYISGGAVSTTSPNTTNVIDKFVFSTETCFAILATMSSVTMGHASVNSDIHGYMSGGSRQVGSLSTIDRLEFGTETVTTLSTTLIEGRTLHTGVQSGSL